jgi:hypothetical protein
MEVETYRIYLQAYASALCGIITPTQGASLQVCAAVAIASKDAAKFEPISTAQGLADLIDEMLVLGGKPCA